MLHVHDSSICIGEVDMGTDRLIFVSSGTCPRSDFWTLGIELITLANSWRTQSDWSVHVQCMSTGVKEYSWERTPWKIELTRLTHCQVSRHDIYLKKCHVWHEMYVWNGLLYTVRHNWRCATLYMCGNFWREFPNLRHIGRYLEPPQHRV